MARRKKNRATSIVAELAELTRPLEERKEAPPIWGMTDVGLDLFAFDMAEREAVAEIRASVSETPVERRTQRKHNGSGSKKADGLTSQVTAEVEVEPEQSPKRVQERPVKRSKKRKKNKARQSIGQTPEPQTVTVSETKADKSSPSLQERLAERARKQQERMSKTAKQKKPGIDSRNGNKKGRPRKKKVSVTG